MGSTAALIVFSAFILTGFIFEAQVRKKVTPAIWLPLFWMIINASRSINSWLGLSVVGSDERYLEVNMEGSLVDKIVLTSAIFLGVMIIYRRRKALVGFFKTNKALFAFILYLGVSFLWSDIPGVSLRRWIRLVGDIIMVVVLMTEPEPVEAVKSVFRRCAYLLIPLSVMLIKYFPHMGIEYHRWTGEQMWIGVALQKNGLGHLSFVMSFFLIWETFSAWGRKVDLKYSRTIYDLIILMLCLFLLKGPGHAYSSTSIACLVLGIAILMFSMMPVVKRNFEKIGVSVILTTCLFFVLQYSFGIIEIVVTALGRNMTFTDRVPLWNALVDIGLRNPFGGYGYGGFWTPERIIELQKIGGDQVVDFTQGHSGYLELFVEGGIMAIVLLGVLLISVLKKITRSGLIDYEYAVFRLSFFMMILLANITESSFPGGRTLLTFVFFIIALNYPSDSTLRWSPLPSANTFHH